MRKWLSVLLALCLLLMSCGCASTIDAPEEEIEEEASWDWKSLPKAQPTGVTINVYNWGQYIDPGDGVDVNAAFTHLTGIEVNYKTFDSNEDMYALISSGAADYDVVFPSDYMIGKMIDEGMLAKLNFDNIPNYRYIDDRFKNMAFDPDNAYSVPYTWGVVGIFYNTKYVDEEDLELGWDLLWCEKYKNKILMFNNPRDAFGITEKKLGFSLNTTDKEELTATYEELDRQKPVLQGYVMDQIYDKMINEDAYIAPYFNGDGTVMMDPEEGNENIAFFVPEEGTNIFYDSACVLKTTRHQAEAEAYINFLNEPEIALANAEYIGYSTPHTEAYEMLDDEIKEDETFYPPDEIISASEAYITLPPEPSELIEKLWIKLKR